MNYPRKITEAQALNALAADLAKVQPCRECGEPTTGSIGAAGLKWPSLCQACKDKADAAQLKVCVTIATVGQPRPQAPVGVTRVCCVCESHMTYSPGEEDYGEHTGWNRIKTPAVWACENCEHQENDE